MPEKIKFFSTNLNISSRGEILEDINAGDILRIATVNPEFMLEARKNSTFRGALERMTHCTIDGSGVLGALKFQKKKLHIGHELELYHGADLVKDLFDTYKDGSKTFFFVGGPEGVALAAKKKIEELYPGIRIDGATDGGKIDPSSPLKDDFKQELLEKKPDILLVGFGAPKQELFMQAAFDLPVQVMIGVGGTFHFYTDKKRAPQFIRKLHFEWLYRAFTEKGHLKRAFRSTVVYFFIAIGDYLK